MTSDLSQATLHDIAMSLAIINLIVWAIAATLFSSSRPGLG